MDTPRTAVFSTSDLDYLSVTSFWFVGLNFLISTRKYRKYIWDRSTASFILLMVTNQRILIHSVVLKRFPPLPDLPPLNPNRSQQMTEVFSCYKGFFSFPLLTSGCSKRVVCFLSITERCYLDMTFCDLVLHKWNWIQWNFIFRIKWHWPTLWQCWCHS